MENSYLLSTAENGCKTKASTVLGKLFLCGEEANGSREVQKNITTAEPSVTQPQSMQTTEKDKAVKNDNLC